MMAQTIRGFSEDEQAIIDKLRSMPLIESAITYNLEEGSFTSSGLFENGDKFSITFNPNNDKDVSLFRVINDAACLNMMRK